MYKVILIIKKVTCCKRQMLVLISSLIITANLTAQDALGDDKPKYQYGIKTNTNFWWYGNDFSFFFEKDKMAIQAGYSIYNNFGSSNWNIKGFNCGLKLDIYQFNDNLSLTGFVLNSRYKTIRPNGYKVYYNVFNINPNLEVSMLKKTILFDIGPSLSYLRTKRIVLGNEPTYDSELRPCLLAHFSINLAPLFKK